MDADGTFGSHTPTTYLTYPPTLLFQALSLHDADTESSDAGNGSLVMVLWT
jgi:hypothetical protein